ncbi:MAG: nucleotidyltransferase domain-containing protein [Candidatus Aminicenantes bacterium]|nr:nucleotidyltransferase domain-containing protein [Candidatus Aminicenantes bacterium]
MNTKNINASVSELKRVLNAYFGNKVELYLFGSTARNEYTSNSDIDILVLISGEVKTALEEKVIDLAYDIELEYDVVFGIIVYSKEFWLSGKARVMPFHQNVQREALRI